MKDNSASLLRLLATVVRALPDKKVEVPEEALVDLDMLGKLTISVHEEKNVFVLRYTGE